MRLQNRTFRWDRAGAVVAAFPPVPDPQDSSLWARVARGWHRITGGSS